MLLTQMSSNHICLTRAVLVSVSNRVYRERAASVFSTPFDHRAHGSRHSTRGIVECASWPGFLLEVRMSPESLSRQYFWLGQLDQGQLYSVRMIICLAYIPDMRKNFKKVIFLKNLFSKLGYFAGIWVNLTTENSWCSRTREVTLTHISSFFSKPDANITNNAS